MIVLSVAITGWRGRLVNRIWYMLALRLWYDMLVFGCGLQLSELWLRRGRHNLTLLRQRGGCHSLTLLRQRRRPPCGVAHSAQVWTLGTSCVVVASCGEIALLLPSFLEDKLDLFCSERGNHNRIYRRWCNSIACPTNDAQRRCGNLSRSTKKLCNRCTLGRHRPWA